jgi:hypothetical protein
MSNQIPQPQIPQSPQPQISPTAKSPKAKSPNALLYLLIAAGIFVVGGVIALIIGLEINKNKKEIHKLNEDLEKLKTTQAVVKTSRAPVTSTSRTNIKPTTSGRTNYTGSQNLSNGLNLNNNENGRVSGYVTRTDSSTIVGGVKSNKSESSINRVTESIVTYE